VSTKASSRDEPLLSTRWTIGIACVLAAAVFATIRVLGLRQFGAEDGGITAALAYMVKIGYRPYTDIQTTGFPPLYFLLGGAAFKLLGVSWQSLVTLTAAFAALSLVAQTWLLERARFGRMTAIAVATLTQCATLLPLSNWWYNQMTSVLGTLFASAALALLARPKDRGVWTALVLSAALLSWSKPNVAALLLLGVGVALLLSDRTRITGPLLMLSAAIASVVGLVLVGVNPALVIQSYLSAAGRVSPGNFIDFFWVNDHGEAVRTLALLVPGLAAGLVAAFAWARSGHDNVVRTSALAAISGVAILASFVAMGTNNDHNLVEVPLIILGCVTLIRVSGLNGRSILRGIVLGALGLSIAALAVTGMYSAFARERIESIGPNLFYEDVALSRVGGNAFMADVQTGPAFKQAISDVSTVLRLNPSLTAADTQVFFGPRLLEMYPEFGIAPPKGLPTWWGLYADGQPATGALVRIFVAEMPALAVFYRGDYTFYPTSLLEVLRTRYDVYNWGSLTLHARHGANVQLPNGATRAN